MSTSKRDRLVALRRELHQHPEPAWNEFWTTARIVEELREYEVDELYIGREALADTRMALPDESELETWMAMARERDVDPDILEKLAGGWTGAVAVIEQGSGPTVGLRVDIDALAVDEATDSSHVPAAQGFRSNTDAMHACGHDAHATIGIGVIESIIASEFDGTLKVFFQPAEEVIGGGKPMAESGHLDDVEYLFAVHVGLDRPTGTVVAGIDGFLAVTQFMTTFTGQSAHAGGRPEAGRNAVQAMATAVQNLYAIPRHGDGSSRINAGHVGGGSATNIIPDEAFIHGEARGETTAIRDFVYERVEGVMEHAAAMHDCEYEIEVESTAPSAQSDQELVDIVQQISAEHPDVSDTRARGTLGGSEDATFLMNKVQEQGGFATYVVIGTDHPGGHHSSTFDVDEDSIEIGVDILSDAICMVATTAPTK